LTGKERARAALQGEKTDRVARYADVVDPGHLISLGGLGELASVRAAKALGLDMTRAPGLPPVPVPPGAGRSDVKKILDVVLDSFREAADRAADAFLVLMEFPHALLGAMMARHGAMETLSILADDPSEAARRLEEDAEVCVALAEGIASFQEVEAVLFMDDLAGAQGPFISPDTLRALYFPRVRHVFDTLASAGIRVLFHSDGDVSTIAEDILASGAAGHHPVEAGGNWGLDAASAGNAVLVGNAALGFLAASESEAAEEGRRCRSFGARHPRYFMAPASEIGSEVPLENILAFFGLRDGGGP